VGDVSHAGIKNCRHAAFAHGAHGKGSLAPEPRLQSAPGFAEELDKTAQAQKEKKAELSPQITGNTPAPKDPMWESACCAINGTAY